MAVLTFTSTQLSWIVIGACSIGGTGYISMSTKIEDLDKRLTVVYTHMDYQTKTVEKMSQQLERIELKLENQKK